MGIILDHSNRTQLVFGGGEDLPKAKTKKRNRKEGSGGKYNRDRVNNSNQVRKQDTKGEFGHPDDIRSLILSDDKTKCITGSNGREPFIFVWDTQTAGQTSKDLI